MELWEPDGEITRVLVVTAHPDDVDFGAAGTVGTMTDAGIEVTYCIVTDGDAGGSDLSVSREEMAATRRKEQLTAAAKVGVDSVCFLGYPDGRLTSSLELRRDLSRVIRQVRPEIVITQSPDRNWDRIYASHPDHLAAGEAAACAVYPDARNPFAHPELLQEEGLEPHTVKAMWLMAMSDANVSVEITKTFDRKIEALKSHVSQVGAGEQLEGIIRPWARGNAEALGLEEPRLVESFRAVNTI